MSESVDVAVLMGSKSDWDVMKHAVKTLREFDIACEARVLSAHRTPAETKQYVEGCDSAGTRVFIAAAGMAAHLAGAVASHTVRPVIGVPLSASDLKGMDALLATVQMPPGIPVATVSIGKPGAINAALLAVSILGNERPALRDSLLALRKKRAEAILAEKLDE